MTFTALVLFLILISFIPVYAYTEDTFEGKFEDEVDSNPPKKAEPQKYEYEQVQEYLPVEEVKEKKDKEKEKKK